MHFREKLRQRQSNDSYIWRDRKISQQICFRSLMDLGSGLSIDKEFERKGVMYQSLKFTLEHIQNVLKLHRVMANYMPHNKRSERLLERIGFKREGHAEEYLKINGKWEDHVLTSLIFRDTE